jgi:predicted Rossmann fold flavoprotein
MHWEVIVVGAGAAGLMAGTRAAERGCRTLLLEKNRKPGAKLLMSGGTRCNLTHQTDSRGIVEAFGRQGRFLHSALAALNPQEVVQFFAAEGVATKVEETGKIFPASDRAADVLQALMSRLRRSGCELALDEPLAKIDRTGDGFQLTTSNRMLQADKVIVTTGGQSYPGCGTTGDGYDWLSSLGHTIIKPRPALTPITTNATWVRELRGVTIPDVAVRLSPGTKTAASGAKRGKKTRYLDQRRGSFLFTHFGLSGPVALDISRTITAHPQPNTLILECDFLPTVETELLSDLLANEYAKDGKKQLVGILARHIPRRLAEAMMLQLGLPAELKAAEVSKRHRLGLVAAIKQNRFPVSGTRGFGKAEVTAGGVALIEVDSRTMQSKLVPNLFIAGELLDLDGPIGGYNFLSAFSTAWLAGEHV